MQLTMLLLLFNLPILASHNSQSTTHYLKVTYVFDYNFCIVGEDMISLSEIIMKLFGIKHLIRGCLFIYILAIKYRSQHVFLLN